MEPTPDERALRNAVAAGNLKLLEEMRAAGADLRSLYRDIVLDYAGHNRQFDYDPPEPVTLLHYAAAAGQTETLCYLLEAGLRVDGAPTSASPLHVAAAAGETKAMEALLAKGAKPDAQDVRGHTPLMAAVGAGPRLTPPSTWYCDPRERDELRWKWHRDWCPEVEPVRLLLDRGAELEHRVFPGLTPLGIAAQRGAAAVVRLLVERGANCCHIPSNLVGPYIPAVQAREHPEIAEFLLVKTAEANPELAFLTAAYLGRCEILSALLGKGVNINTTDPVTRERCLRRPGGWTALRFAVLGAQTKTVGFLLSRGADIEEYDRNGRTALMDAISVAKPDLVELLLAKGANVNAKTRAMPVYSWTAGDTVLQLADKSRRSFVTDARQREAIYAMIKARIGGL